MSERTPLKGSEYSTLLTLFAMVSGFNTCLDSVEKRCRAAGCWEHMQAVGQLASDCLDEILKTVPDKKLLQIQKNLANVRIYIKTQPPGLTDHVDAFSYTPTDAVNELLNYLCQHECSMCDKSSVEARHCPWRKLIEDTLPHDVECNDREHCKYSDLVLGLEEL